MSKGMLSLLVSVALLAACVGDSRPAPFGQVRKGEILAREWCAACHAVAADQQPVAAVGQGPSFTRIAASSRFSAQTLRRFLAEEHLPMPTFRLKPEEREDIAAYLLSLRGRE